MFDWLFEGQTTVYILLAAALLGFFFIYWQYRRKAWLYAMAVVAALIGAYWLLDRLRETDREQIQCHVEEMANGLRAHDLDAVFDNFSEDFRSPQNKDKKELRDFARQHINGVTKVVVWDLRWQSRPERGKEFEGLRFSFKVFGVGLDDRPGFDCQPVFEFDPATNRWRVKRLKIFLMGTGEPINIF